MGTETLTSLAMLKVNVDRGGDYLDYLRPFILHVLVVDKPDPVTDSAVCGGIRQHFGLEIPERTVQLVLKRIARSYPLQKESGVYHIVGKIDTLSISDRKSEAEGHIEAVVSELMNFAKTTPKQSLTRDEAISGICTFLAEFSIPCLRAYLRGTTIPQVEGDHETDILLVSQYVVYLQRQHAALFDSFMVMMQGHMLANALLCPDLQNAPRTYRGVTFYLDTPLLIRRLGLEGEPKRVAVEGLIELLRDLGATVAAFAHSRHELEGVVKRAAEHLDDATGRGAIIVEASRIGTTKSDLLLLAGQIDDRLSEVGINVVATPTYVADFQIDESLFEEVLDDEVSYYNPRAREADINSVRSVYVLRARTSPTSIENCKTVLVTSNAAFARAAYQYGQRYEESREVSSVITDFSLANMAWLKAPVSAALLPRAELLAFAYAALQPSRDLLKKYLTEIEKLQESGQITERDHQLLRSSVLAQEELMHLTLGEEGALTSETVEETLRRVTAEIRREESERVEAERSAHQETQQELIMQLEESISVRQRVSARCRTKARLCSWVMVGGVSILLVVGSAVGFGLRASHPTLGWLLFVLAGVAAVVGVANTIFGSSVRSVSKITEEKLYSRFVRREAQELGISMDEYL